MKKRPEWDKYFLKLAMLASERATCPRMHCGCVLVKNKNVIATGYNGDKPRVYFRNKDYEADYQFLKEKLPGKEVNFGSSTTKQSKSYEN